MFDEEIRLKLQVGVLWDLHKKGLITKKELDKCIDKIMRKESKSNEPKKGSSLLSG